jgi:large-conductance mechanosensitive channel
MRMKQTKRLLLAGFAALSLAFAWGGVQFASHAWADSTTDAKNNACDAIGGTATNGSCSVDGPSLDNVITTIINVLSIIIGLVAVVMIMVGGFKYITSGGDSGSVSSAKNTIVYAVIGLVIVALAQFIVQFVINKAREVPKPKPKPKAAIVLLVPSRSH